MIVVIQRDIQAKIIAENLRKVGDKTETGKMLDAIFDALNEIEKKAVNSSKYILIETNGYQIDEHRFPTKAEAAEYMQSRYNSLIPEFWTEEEEMAEKEMSYCNDDAATLYTGENVYVWKLIET